MDWQHYLVGSEILKYAMAELFFFKILHLIYLLRICALQCAVISRDSSFVECEEAARQESEEQKWRTPSEQQQQSSQIRFTFAQGENTTHQRKMQVLHTVKRQILVEVLFLLYSRVASDRKS
jgi:hypothetical protein